jgi:hypothetical protein
VFGFSQANLSDEYQNSTRLDNKTEPSYMLYWTYNSGDSTISFAVKAKTTGWVGFGFANKIDTKEDIVMGYKDDFPPVRTEIRVCILFICLSYFTLLKYARGIEGNRRDSQCDNKLST